MVQTNDMVPVFFRHEYNNDVPFTKSGECQRNSKQLSNYILEEINDEKYDIEQCLISKLTKNEGIDITKNLLDTDLEETVEKVLDTLPSENARINFYIKYGERKSKDTNDSSIDVFKEHRRVRRNRNGDLGKSEEIAIVNKYVEQDLCLRSRLDNTQNIETNKTFFFNKVEASNYVGLVNQAMTCYLNSLLQALYMTPEFRNALYNWEYTGTEKCETNIPFQLQKLFLNLQTSDKIAVETTALTYSFGWDSSEAWNQHDIQELCRVMFDALEKTFKNTKQADFINRLYEGKINDYVKCLTCNTEKSREDSFLDIPLPLRSFDGSTTYGSVEEALEAFVKYEILEGNNQYFCEKCNKKSNAHKGLKFSKFPYILTLQLKRFDFDHNTYHRIKLNDKVTFPDVLNLNSFIASSTNQESPSHEEDPGMSVKCDDSATDSSTVDDELCGIPISMNNHTTNTNHDQEDDEGIEICNGVSPSVHSNEEKMREHYARSKGPYIYELFCIMIHSGSASGGHYYAYIKDFRFDKWLSFDDQRVSQITEKDIQNTYGGGTRGPYYSAFRSSTNAYMLMYRQIDKEHNAMPMQAEDFPPHIKELLEKMRKYEEDRSNNYLTQDYGKSHYKIPVSIRQVNSLEPNKCLKIDFSMSHLVKEISEIAYKDAFEDSEYDPERCRLVVYNTKYDLIEYVMEPNKPIDHYFDDHTKMKDLLLEVREPNEEFEPCPSTHPVITKVYIVDLEESELIDGPKYIRGYLNQNVAEYLLDTKKYFNIDLNSVSIFAPEIQPNAILEHDFIFENMSNTYPYIVCLTQSSAPYKDKSTQLSAFKKMYDRVSNTATFYIDISNITKENLENLKIPSLDSYYREEKTQDSASNHNCLTEELAKIYVSSDKCRTNFEDGTEVDSTTVNDLPPTFSGKAWALEEINNSEDSSLSDSDKTIVNEATDDVEMMDDEAQSFITDKVLEMQQPYGNAAKNGETMPPDTIFTIEHQKKNKMLKITAPKDVTEEQLKEKLRPYLKIPKNYFKIIYNMQEPTYPLSSTLCIKNDRKYSITLGRILATDESFVDIYSLRMCDLDPLQLLFTTVLEKTSPIICIVAKQQIFAELQKNNCVDVPFERLRFYEVLPDNTVGDIFADGEKYLESMSKICVQELPPKEASESNDITVYVRRWNRNSLKLDDVVEIFVSKVNFNEELKNQISAESNIPKERLEFTVQAARKNFTPTKIENFKWNSYVQCRDVDSRSYVIYRNSCETPAVTTFHDVQSSTMVRRAVSDRLATFSRREKALKIHVDT